MSRDDRPASPNVKTEGRRTRGGDGPRRHPLKATCPDSTTPRSEDGGSAPVPSTGAGLLQSDLEVRPTRPRSQEPRCPTAKKKLYIETVGCQMNVLDSELVVGKLRQRGVRADRRHRPGRHDPLQHLLGPPARRGQDLQRPRPGPPAQGDASPALTIGVLGCMAQKDQGQILRRAPHVDVVVGPGQLGRVSELLALAKERGQAADGRQPAADRRQRATP